MADGWGEGVGRTLYLCCSKLSTTNNHKPCSALFSYIDSHSCLEIRSTIDRRSFSDTKTSRRSREVLCSNDEKPTRRTICRLSIRIDGLSVCRSRVVEKRCSPDLRRPSWNGWQTCCLCSAKLESLCSIPIPMLWTLGGLVDIFSGNKGSLVMRRSSNAIGITFCHVWNYNQSRFWV